MGRASQAARAGLGPVAFLFLGEMLLVPHLFPIVEALSEDGSVDLELWISTSAHELLLAPWVRALERPNVRLRRAPGFARLPDAEPGRNPPLPPKIPMLLALAPQLLGRPVAVCAEQTSLWLPTVLPMRTRFVKTSHGVGSVSARDDRRRRSAAVMLVPSERERRTYLARGHDRSRVVATGYVKASFRQRTGTRIPFPEARPVILYTPHWQRWRSSWWAWGRQVLELIERSGRWNLIFAPHQRLVEAAPDVREAARALAACPHVHCDLDSFAMVDGSYTEAADIYLGDTSSQVLEFLARPRPCVFLNPWRFDWRADASHAQWTCGEVVEDLGDLPAALERAGEAHAAFRPVQLEFAAASLGDVSGAAPRRAAREIRRLLEAERRTAAVKLSRA